MAHPSNTLHMIMFLLLSLHCTRSHIVAATANHEHYNDYYKVEKVSGVDDIHEKEGLIVEKFRALLGLRSFRGRNGPSSSDLDLDLSSSPTPCPSPSMEMDPPAPSPEPAEPVRVHFHAHPGHKLRPSRAHKEDPNKGRAARVVAAVLGSAGAAVLVCVLGFVCVCLKLRRQRGKISRTMPSFGKKGRGLSLGGGRSRNVSSPRKVSGNPGLDLIYLNSLEMDLERENPCHKQDSEDARTSPDHASPECALHNKEEEVFKSECDGNASSFSTREISPDIADERGDCRSPTGDKIINVDPHPSYDDHDDDDDDDDDVDSFHSFSDSHSSRLRLSNASIASLSDKSEILSPKVSKSSPSSTPNPSDPSLCFGTAPSATSETQPSNDGEKTSRIAPSPPPPPPLPPPSAHFSPLRVPRVVSKVPTSTLLSPRNPPPPLPRVVSKVPTSTSLSPRNSPQPSPLPSQGSSSNVPPPPCPPPFLKGNGKAPPPPPPQLQVAPLGKDGYPLPKLKPLHWDKVRATPDRSMVWDKMRSSSFELDEEMMESLFGYNLQSSTKNDEAKSKTSSPGKHILDQKRLQNITILSKALNASPEQICYALIQGEGLCLQQLEALAKMVPTKEEEAKLCSYKGDRNELGSAERFVIAVLSVPFAFLRIEAMLYRETFEDEVIHLRRSFSMLEEACKELRSSRLFLKLLEAVLKTGNRMNVGTIRGGAKAFKLDTLLKLADVKGTDGRTTLLHFVVQEIIRSEGIRVSDSIMGKISGLAKKCKTVEEKEDEYRRMGLELVSGLSTELYNVKKTATIDLDVLESSVSNLSEGLARLNQLVDKDLRESENGGNFVKSMKAFLSSADNKLEELQEDESNVMVHVRQVTEYFHGELSKSDTNPLRIFVIVRDFLGMLDHVCKELRSFKPPTSPNPLPSFR